MLDGVFFAGFERNDYYKSGAISFQLSSVYFTASQSSVKNVMFAFDDSVRIFLLG